jgi:hypothetical protein
LTRGLNFSGKREALLDLLRHRTIPLDQFDRINEYLTVVHTFTPLHNDIAHSKWKLGSSSSRWIQPDWVLRTPSRVKPLHSDPGVGGEDLVERAEDKLAYSLKDLDETVETFAANYANLSGYLLRLDYPAGDVMAPPASVCSSPNAR